MEWRNRDQEGRSFRPRNAGPANTEKHLGRPPVGADLVDSITSASETARRRLKVVLRTLAGGCTIEGACEELGIGRTRFFALRQRFLVEAAHLLEPRTPGPKPRVVTDAERRAEALEAHVGDLEIEVMAAQVREELALAVPAVVKSKTSSGPQGKKRGERHKRRRRRRAARGRARSA